MKVNRSAVVATLAILALAACGGSTSDTTSPPVTSTTTGVSGRVIDTDSSNGGVGGASVTLAVSGSAGQNLTTQANGSFGASSLQPGSYTLTLITPAGYALPPAETGTRSVVLAASNTAVPVSDFQLIRTRGTVTGSARNGVSAVAAATVSLTRPGFTTRGVATDATGAFSFSAVPSGVWTVSMTTPSGLRAGTGETGTRSIQVNANVTTQVSAFAFEPGPAQTVVEVHISQANFSPATITVAAGTTVRWIADDAGSHTITPQSTTQPGVFARVVFGGSTGVVLQHTFSTPNQTYRYRCEPHSDSFTSGMVGQVIVQ